MIQNIFISYSSSDIEIAAKICNYLENRGIHCFIAPRDILPGTEYGEEIIKAIESSNMLLLVCTETAINSQHVLREVERAVSKRIPLLTLKLDRTELNKSFEYFLQTNQFLYAYDGVDSHLYEVYDVMMNYKADNQEAKQVEEPQPPQPQPQQTVPAKSSKKLMPLFVVLLVLVLVAGIVTGIMINKPNDDSETDNSVSQTMLKTGDYISFGSYGVNGASDAQKVLWVVVNVDEEGNAILLSDQILALYPFDTAESGAFDKDSQGNSFDRDEIDTYTDEQMTEFRGNSDWETSTIRTWLNSEESLVAYEGAAPVDKGTDECDNGYDTKAGFLSLFSEKEKNALVEYSTVTETNALNDDNQKTTTDKVFLLSEGELYSYVIGNNISPYTDATQNAIDNDESTWYMSFTDSGYDNYIWALRTPVSENAYKIKVVGAGEDKEIDEYYAAASGIGIRPAIQITTAELSFSGDGSRLDPYTEE